MADHKKIKKRRTSKRTKKGKVKKLTRPARKGF